VKKIGGILFVLALAVSLVLVPSPVSAGIGDDCTWDPVKWEGNENSWNLYLKHWGRTPTTAMSRLAGLCGPDVICSDTFGIKCPIPRNTCWQGACTSCRTEEEGCLAACDDPLACKLSKSGEACSALGATESPECPSEPIVRSAPCSGCWGVSLSFANKGWAGCDINAQARFNNDHPNHFGNSTGGAENRGGDWGITGSPHTECVSKCWALQDNMCWSNGTGCGG